MPLDNMKLYQKVGRQGMILLVFGGVCLVLGLSLVDPSGGGKVPTGYNFVYENVNHYLRGVLWIITGILATIGAFYFRPKPILIGILIFFPLVNAFAFIWSFVDYLLPTMTDGYRGGLYSAAFYFALASLVFIAATERDR